MIDRCADDFDSQRSADKSFMADVASPRPQLSPTSPTAARARVDDVTRAQRAADAPAPPTRLDAVEQRRPGAATPRAPAAPTQQSTAQRFAPVRALAAAA